MFAASLCVGLRSTCWDLMSASGAHKADMLSRCVQMRRAVRHESAVSKGRKHVSKLTSFLFCLSVAITLSTGASAGGNWGPGYGYVDLGGVNLTYYCSKTFGSGFKSVLIGTTAGDWRCQQGKSKETPKQISVENACKLQYGKPGLKAKALNWNDPLSWRCFAPRKPK